MRIDLESLLERVKAATGPDRDLDDAIAVEFGYDPRHSATGGRMTYRNPDGKYIGVAPQFTSSVDAALSLISRALPGWKVSMDIEGEVATDCYLIGPYYNDSTGEGGSLPFADMPVPLALLAATLSALQERS